MCDICQAHVHEYIFGGSSFEKSNLNRQVFMFHWEVDSPLFKEISLPYKTDTSCFNYQEKEIEVK